MIDRKQLAGAVNRRRVRSGKEPFQLWRVQRAIRFVLGAEPKVYPYDGRGRRVSYAGMPLGERAPNQRAPLPTLAGWNYVDTRPAFRFEPPPGFWKALGGR